MILQQSMNKTEYFTFLSKLDFINQIFPNILSNSEYKSMF